MYLMADSIIFITEEHNYMDQCSLLYLIQTSQKDAWPTCNL